MKTEKYAMEAWIGDNIMSTYTKLTKKDYIRILAELTEQLHANPDDGREFYVEHRFSTLYLAEKHYKRHIHYFTHATSEIVLIYDVADNGYRFT